MEVELLYIVKLSTAVAGAGEEVLGHLTQCLADEELAVGLVVFSISCFKVAGAHNHSGELPVVGLPGFCYYEVVPCVDALEQGQRWRVLDFQ